MAKKLNANQSAFVNAYLANGFNATQAAVEAGYSAKTARQQGSRLLTNADVRARVDERMAELAMSANEAIARLAAIGRGDMREFIGLSIEKLKEHPAGGIIKKVKMGVAFDLKNQRVDYVETIEAYDAQSALVSIIKELRLDAGKPTETFDLTNNAKSRLEHLLARRAAESGSDGDPVPTDG